MGADGYFLCCMGANIARKLSEPAADGYELSGGAILRVEGPTPVREAVVSSFVAIPAPCARTTNKVHVLRTTVLHGRIRVPPILPILKYSCTDLLVELN